MNSTHPDKQPQETHIARRHLRFGWWSLLVFLGLGILLEGLLALRIEEYLGAPYQTRRLMWRLAHAHGTLFGLVHLAFGLTCQVVGEASLSRRVTCSRCLIGASFLLPGGFFLGGIRFYGGDPGLGVFLVPVGAILMFVAVLLTAISLPRNG